MRRYSIYLIDYDVARNYLGKEEKLYQLFLEAEDKMSPYQSILRKQINYITKKIPVSLIHETFLNNIGTRMNANKSKQTYEIFIDGTDSRAVLVMKKNCLNLFSEGTYEAETIFFEELRKIEPSFLAMDFHRDYYGWLNPIKHAKLV